jgi:CheY-like chemotaxis protein
MAVAIHCLGADPTDVARVLSRGARRISCTRLPATIDLALRCVREHAPDFVVLGKECGASPALAAALADDPSTEDLPIIGWDIAGTPLEAPLSALGVRVVGGGDEILLRACEEALDLRDGRTVRVDSPVDEEGEALHGRRVIVADDDAAVAWFVADALRRAGCDVDEVLDGRSALVRARGVGADLVLCDIRMPELDGLRLCRALRADPVLGDIGVVLLSWKTDWLKRAEAAGACASAYLPKHAPPEEVVERAREAIAPHLRIERRFREEGAVRGLLDGVSPYRLLRLACAMRPESRLMFQCGPEAYEVLVRSGAPRTASRVSSGGAMVRGLPALEALLSERVGRFVVTTDRTPIEHELGGSLQQLIAPLVARTRVSLEPRDVTAPLPPVVLQPPPPVAPEVLADGSLPVPLVVQIINVPAPRTPKRARRRGPSATRHLAVMLVAIFAVALGSDVRPVTSTGESIDAHADMAPDGELDGPSAPSVPGARAFHGPLAHRRELP